MPHDGATPNGATSKSPTSTLSGQLVKGINPNKVIVWDTAECLGQFHDLVMSPPLHSLVIHIEPPAAEQLLLVTNNRNRPMSGSWVKRLSSYTEENYELTGDTIKFSKSGIMLDGQHRLNSCIKTKKPIVSHVVFGLDETIFDVLDQGKKRTAGDILALQGVQDYTTTAAAISWVQKIKDGVKNFAGMRLTPRQIGRLAVGEMKDVSKWATEGRLVSTAFKGHPPSMITAILYLIARHDSGVAKDFAHEWVHGAKIGRNENFNVLSQRLISIAHQSGGHVNHFVRAALIVQMFNHWNAGEVASPRSLSWRKSLKFPALEFDKGAFKRRREKEAQDDSSLTANQMRVFETLLKAADERNKVQMTTLDISMRARVAKGSVHYLLGTLVDEGMLSMVEPSSGNTPAVYRIRADDASALLSKK